MLALLLLLAGPPLADAKQHLEQGKLDEVLFDLDGKALAESDKPAAADLLARAGEAALKKDDELLALQFAQMALRLAKDDPHALEIGARAARTAKQYSPAEDYADRWVRSGAAHGRALLLRAELATDQGEWEHGEDLVSGVKESELPADERPRLQLVKQTCKRMLADHRASVSTLKSLERRLDAAAEQAKKQRTVVNALPPRGSNAGSDVVVYGTSWCGYCAQARKYLQEKGVPFTDKDVERDAGVATELAQKLAAAHMRATGVPIIDVRGSLVVGFDRGALDRLLR
jgi:mycoredoxin